MPRRVCDTCACARADVQRPEPSIRISCGGLPGESALAAQEKPMPGMVQPDGRCFDPRIQGGFYRHCDRVAAEAYGDETLPSNRPVTLWSRISEWS